MRHDTTRQCIIPPHVLDRLLESDDAAIRSAAMTTLLTTARLRGEREVRASLVGRAAPRQRRRRVCACQTATFLPLCALARSEDGPASADRSVNQAFDGLGSTRQLYQDV